MSKTYTADVRWEDGQWQATARDLAGAHTYARTLNALGKRLREVVVLMDGRPDTELEDENAFTVTLIVEGSRSAPAGLSGEGTLSAVRSGGSTARVVLSSSGTLQASAAGMSKSSGAAAATMTATSALTVGGRPDDALVEAAAARHRAAEAEQEADHATSIAVLVAQQAGIGMRDIALLLGVSHQRVQQIAAAGLSAGSRT